MARPDACVRGPHAWRPLARQPSGGHRCRSAANVQRQPPATPGTQSVVVTGIRASLETSLSLKRDAQGWVDGITAEDIGKFPDTNLAESLQRISGVSIDRSIGEGSRVEKEYLVTSNQAFENSHLDQFLEGVFTTEGKLKAKVIERLSSRRLKVVLDHGAKRQIRVMFDTLGYQVTKLIRVRIGALWLGDLEPGAWAALNSVEIQMLLGNPKPAKKREAAEDGRKKRLD